MMTVGKTTERGFTLIELMIGLLLGLIVMGMVLTMFVSTIGSTRQVGATVRLNQELRAVNEMMIRASRRAGYWAGDDVASNPHASLVGGQMQIGVFNTAAPTVMTTSGDCLVVSYDADNDGSTSADEIEIIGFRYDGGEGAVEVSDLKVAAGTASVDCDNDIGWQNLTDEDVIRVTSLSFSVVPGVSIASLAEATSKSLSIFLEAEVRSDDRINNQLQSTVKIRNSSF